MNTNRNIAYQIKLHIFGHVDFDKQSTWPNFIMAKKKEKKIVEYIRWRGGINNIVEISMRIIIINNDDICIGIVNGAGTSPYFLELRSD